MADIFDEHYQLAVAIEAGNPLGDSTARVAAVLRAAQANTLRAIREHDAIAGDLLHRMARALTGALPFIEHADEGAACSACAEIRALLDEYAARATPASAATDDGEPRFASCGACRPPATCHGDACGSPATHGPDGVAVACWQHSGDWPEVTP